jgi:Ca2+-binding EF-hand superfamily protein
MRWIALFAPLLITVTATAQAGDWKSGDKSARGPIDANNDGIVTREEAKAHPRLSADFDAADSNKDGQLDAAEMSAHRERMRAEMRSKADERWKAADTDGDGKLSLAEAQASMPHMAERFQTFDADKDGPRDAAEMSAHRERLRAELLARRRAPWDTARCRSYPKESIP